MAREYTPRRASKRWLDADCPKGVLAIFDSRNCGERYTILYAEPLRTDRGVYIQGVGCCETPFHPQGIGQHFELEAWQAAQYRYRSARHKAKWSSLPEDVKRLVRQDLSEGAAQ